MSVQTTITSMRNVADFLMLHHEKLESLDYIAKHDPSLPYDQQSYISLSPGCYGDLIVYGTGPRSPEYIAELRRYFGGQWEKAVTEYAFTLKRDIDNVRVTLELSRDNACTRKIVGTETVTIPAVEAEPERTEERQIFEWECDPLLETALESAQQE